MNIGAQHAGTNYFEGYMDDVSSHWIIALTDFLNKMMDKIISHFQIYIYERVLTDDEVKVLSGLWNHG